MYLPAQVHSFIYLYMLGGVFLICRAEEMPTPELSNCVPVTEDLLAFTSGFVQITTERCNNHHPPGGTVALLKVASIVSLTQALICSEESLLDSLVVHLQICLFISLTVHRISSYCFFTLS